MDVTGQVYVTVPRWKHGVPATLNKVNFRRYRSSMGDSTLTPFPSWDMQREGVQGDLQNVQSMTIDSMGRMWVIEVGRRNFLETQAINGNAGVWIIDLRSNRVIHKYIFPDDIVSPTSSFLNDIVVDDRRDIAYFSDAMGDGGLVVYDLGGGTSRRYTGPSTRSDPTYTMVINGMDYGNKLFTTPTDGIAISDDCEAIFYCEIQGTNLYRLPTAALGNHSISNTELDKMVELLGKKEPSDGMKYFKGRLFWGSLTTSTYNSLVVDSRSRPNVAESVKGALVDAEVMNWIDSFAIDMKNKGRLWFTSNRLNEFITGTMDFSGKNGPNMRIMSVPVKDLSHEIDNL